MCAMSCGSGAEDARPGAGGAAKRDIVRRRISPATWAKPDRRQALVIFAAAAERSDAVAVQSRAASDRGEAVGRPDRELHAMSSTYRAESGRGSDLLRAHQLPAR